MTTPPCTHHRWLRYAFSPHTDIYKCTKCATLVERPAGSEGPGAQMKGRA
jgi:hypothetical protein